MTPSLRTAIGGFFLLASFLWLPTLRAADHIDFSLVVVDPATPLNPYCKTVADVNGDGYVDALVASASNGGMFWYAYPDWEKHPIASGSFATDMQAGDIDGDGDPDVISYHDDDAEMVWLENPRPAGDPEGTWIKHLIGAEASAHDVELGDIDRDGKLDVVTRRKRGAGTSVWLQLDPTSWQKLVVSTGAGEGSALGDIDADGDLDIAQNGYWIETPAAPRTAPTPWSEYLFDGSAAGEDVGVLVADLDGNGKQDLLLAPSESDQGALRWFKAQSPKGGEGAWTKLVVDGSVSYLHTFKAADMDLDGDPDLVTAEMHQSTDPDEVSVYFNHVKQGQLENWPQQVIDNGGSHNVRVADVDADGDLDVFGVNWNSSAPDGADAKIWRSHARDALFPRVTLNTSRDLATTGQKLEFRMVGDAMPNAPMALLLWRVNGGWHPSLLLLGTLDGNGARRVSFTVPPMPSSPSLTFECFALFSSLTVASNERTVDFQ